MPDVRSKLPPVEASGRVTFPLHPTLWTRAIFFNRYSVTLEPDENTIAPSISQIMRAQDAANYLFLNPMRLINVRAFCTDNDVLARSSLLVKRSSPLDQDEAIANHSLDAHFTASDFSFHRCQVALSEICDGHTYVMFLFPPSTGTVKLSFTWSPEAVWETIGAPTRGELWIEKCVALFGELDTFTPSEAIDVIRSLGIEGGAIDARLPIVADEMRSTRHVTIPPKPEEQRS